ncbi:ribonuclease H-like domain-containing protein [Leptodontidium sp. 2 PMI_412]|nr:ribonuclease H-like domain-containing protein [Leptodontidium sp. 2 PMI_412]
MDETHDFKSLQDQLQAALIATTRTTGQISAEDLGFHRSFNPEVGTALDEQSERVLALASALLKSAASISDLRAPTLEDADDVENNWRSVVDVVDSLLEKSDTCLDEYTGVIKRKDTTAVEPSTQIPSRSKKQAGNTYRNQNLVKPQLAFDVKPDNSDESPWKPLLTSKPHATVSLEDSLPTFTNDFGQIQHRHPYEAEILQLQYPESMYQKSEPIPYLPFETTSATFIDTEEGVLEMLEELKAASEIAIDLEHHDTRSYVGLVSLMQISTREKDWIVDTLKPWRQNLQVLNEVFADPKIIKVFHGAFMDITWLQRDLGLYVVGLFDTHHASRTLGYAGGSLAFLLKKFINFDADKQYQMADWRIRPLPEEMFFYARADTHFLLYIFDNMRNELIDRSNPEIPDENRIETTLQKSKETSLQRYERQVYNVESGKGPGGWYTQLLKTPSLLDKEQFAVFRAVHEWRDKIARIDDDSPAYVMAQHTVLSIAKNLPMDMVALLRLAHPVSHGVKSRAGELLDIIKQARTQGKDGPSMMDILRPETAGVEASTRTKAPSPASGPVATPKTLVAVMDEGDLRSNNSTFWGGAFGSSVWDAPNTTQTKNDNLRLAVPLPPLSSEIFGTPQGFAEQAEVAKETPLPPSPPPRQETKTDEPFILKRGSKRKSEIISDAEEGNRNSEFDISLDVEEDSKAAAKLQRRAEKKAKKAAKKAAEAEEGAAAEMDVDEDEGDDDDNEVFDYSKAESVLHGKKDGEKGGKRKNQPFDPYVKSMDAPKGMRRLQTERAGKSHTFKS